MAEPPDINWLKPESADQARRLEESYREGHELPVSPAAQPPTAASPDRREVRGRIAPESLRSAADLAPYIDHTLLKPEATRQDVERVAREAREHGFATVCVYSAHVA